MAFFNVNERCNGCLACVHNCPANALTYEDKGSTRSIFHNISLCARCGNCWRLCPQKAIELRGLLEGQWDKVTSMELLRCEVCGEILYTEKFKDTLDKELHQDLRPLCSRHRKANTIGGWAHLARGRRPEAGEGSATR